MPDNHATVFWVVTGHLYFFVAMVRFAGLSSVISSWKRQRWIPKIQNCKSALEKIERKINRNSVSFDPENRRLVETDGDQVDGNQIPETN